MVAIVDTCAPIFVRLSLLVRVSNLLEVIILWKAEPALNFTLYIFGSKEIR